MILSLQLIVKFYMYLFPLLKSSLSDGIGIKGLFMVFYCYFCLIIAVFHNRFSELLGFSLVVYTDVLAGISFLRCCCDVNNAQPHFVFRAF